MDPKETTSLKKKMKKKYLVIGVIVLLAGGYFLYRSGSSNTAAVQYKTATAEKGILTTSISASGNIIVDQSATVDPTITGTVAGLAVNVGDKVEKGQLLFTIENDQLSLDVSKSYASYLQASQSIESAKATKKQAKLDYEDATSKNKSVLEQKLESAEAGVVTAEENLRVASADYQKKKMDAAKRRVTAPIAGTVNAINIKNGDDLSRLSSNNNSSAPIILGDLKTLKAQVAVNEVDIASVSIGQKVMLTFSAIDGLQVSGKVEKMDSLGTLTQGVVTYNVTVSLDSLDQKIKPAMSVSASIITDTKQNVLLVPNSAVKTQNGSTYVQVLSGSTPENKNVEVGLSNDTETEVISGISAGDKVVTQTINLNSASTSGSSNSLRLPGMGGGGRDFH